MNFSKTKELHNAGKNKVTGTIHINFDSGNAMYRATLTLKLNAYIYRKYKDKCVETVGIKLKSGSHEVEYDI